MPLQITFNVDILKGHSLGREKLQLQTVGFEIWVFQLLQFFECCKTAFFPFIALFLLIQLFLNFLLYIIHKRLKVLSIWILYYKAVLKCSWFRSSYTKAWNITVINLGKLSYFWIILDFFRSEQLCHKQKFARALNQLSIPSQAFTSRWYTLWYTSVPGMVYLNWQVLFI